MAEFLTWNSYQPEWGIIVPMDIGKILICLLIGIPFVFMIGMIMTILIEKVIQKTALGGCSCMWKDDPVMVNNGDVNK